MIDVPLPALVTGDVSTVPFFVANALKDTGYDQTMANGSGASKAIADGVRSAIAAVVEGGHGRAYISDLHGCFARRSRQPRPENER
ncbi:hypothetical protein [Bradyrhizobium sp. BR 10261]|uniref:hypothetical protein n=1 Tax=Bradyrhizobium sp. BR 10261 TaxID=2749992 RepID=UPI001C6507AB|nr:hypothetical protein [Bradyrhizobium sp. BR 10261]MBW7961355.1 hypothetical protein [Bradyrhizobium sp. BR 10261]